MDHRMLVVVGLAFLIICGSLGARTASAGSDRASAQVLIIIPPRPQSSSSAARSPATSTDSAVASPSEPSVESMETTATISRQGKRITLHTRVDPL